MEPWMEKHVLARSQFALCRSELTKLIKLITCRGIEMGSNVVINRFILELEKGRGWKGGRLSRLLTTKCCVPPKSYVEALTLKCDGIWRWDHGELISFRWGHESGAPMMGLVSVKEERKTRAFSLSAVWWPSKKTAIYKPEREGSPQPSHTGTLTLDFQPPDWKWEINCCCLSHSACGILLG